MGFSQRAAVWTPRLSSRRTKCSLPHLVAHKGVWICRVLYWNEAPSGQRFPEAPLANSGRSGRFAGSRKLVRGSAV